MILTIQNLEKGLNNRILDIIKENANRNAIQYANYKENALLISYYISMKEFVESNNIKIMTDEYRQNLITEKAVFTNFENDNQRNVYN
jgi:hypothetical protein